MPAITIDVSDETYQQLSAMAVQRQATVEALTARAIEDRIREESEGREAARRLYRQFPTLFDRLKE
jgi:hypothetical protein